MRALLDVNMLIALADPQHVEHQTASEWLSLNWAAGWASCPLTENGCLRVLTGARYPNRYGFDNAFATLATARSRKNHEFWSASRSITDPRVFDRSHLHGHQQITDAYLLALAVSRGGRLVTFDQGIRRNTVIGCGAGNLVVLR